LSCAALAAAADGAAQRRTKLSADERAQCEGRGGRIAIAGLSGNEMCALPLADAGKRCTSGGQCLGECMFDRTGLKGRPPRPGKRVTGRCQATDYPYGCRTTVENERLQPGLCVD
jgi:hypothetical protein